MWPMATWYLVGLVALLMTALSILRLRENIVAVFVADAAGIYLWVLFAIHAFAVEQTTNTGTVIVRNFPSLGYLALGFAVIMILDIFLSVFDAMASEARGSNNGK